MRALVPTSVLVLLVVLSLPAVAQDAPAETEEPPNALILYRQGDLSGAVEVTLDEIAENPSNRDAFSVLGWSLLGLRRYREASDYADRGLAVSARDHRLVHIKAASEYFLGNYDTALVYLERYADIAPSGTRIAEVYFYMGTILAGFGEYRNADVALSMAVHLSANNPSWWVRLGEVRASLSDYAAAEDAFRTAISLDGNNSAAREGLERLESRTNAL